MILVRLVVVFVSLLPLTNGHGRLIEPPSRASAWRYGFDTPHNYNDHELYCGGFTRQWVTNDGKCGVCGDAWDTKLPRAHEYGGTYGQGVIVRKYNMGSVINIRVELTASHSGYFQFSICPDFKNASQDCLDRHVLKMARRPDATKYYPTEGNKVYEMKYRLPKTPCPHCVLQWRYISGNNWGNCPNGTGAIGCGPQEEFRACADITIAGRGVPTEQPITTAPESTTLATTVPATVPKPEEAFSPLATFLVSLVSFLVVFLIFSLLYFHYYQVGRQIKGWIKTKPEKGALSGSQEPPRPPPRVKRRNSHLQEINLNDFESLA